MMQLLQVLCFAWMADARDSVRISSSHTTLESSLTRLAVKRTVVITQASCGYLQFADNWVVHIRVAGVHNFLIVAEDETAEGYLRDQYPGHVVAASMLTNVPLPQRSELIEYWSAGFSQMSCMRPTYMQAVLHLGFSVLWLDLDVAVFVNPFRLLPQGMEYIGVDDSGTLDSEQDSANLCTCFLFLRPTLRVQQLLQMWARRCQNSTSNDQIEWNNVFTTRERKTTDYYIMPQRVFPDGSVVDKRAGSVSDAQSGAVPPDLRPGWLHANFRIGHGLKREFFMHSRAWQARSPDSYPNCTA